MVQLDNILYLHGTNQFLIDRFKNKLIVKKQTSGYQIEELDENYLPLNSFNLFSDKKLYIANIDHIKVDQFLEWVKKIDSSDNCLVFSKKKNNDILSIINPKKVFEFKAPDFFHQAEEAEKFLISEAKNLGKELSKPLAKIIVKKSGTDYGVLSFEAIKLSHVSSNFEISFEDIQGVLSSSIEDPLFNFNEALLHKSSNELYTCLSILNKNFGSSGVVTICSYISPSVLKWLAAALLKEEGKTISESSTLLNLNPWFYENKILPGATRWGSKRLLQLVDHLAKSHRLALEGIIDPWSYFESGVISLVQDQPGV